MWEIGVQRGLVRDGEVPPSPDHTGKHPITHLWAWRGSGGKAVSCAWQVAGARPWKDQTGKSISHSSSGAPGAVNSHTHTPHTTRHCTYHHHPGMSMNPTIPSTLHNLSGTNLPVTLCFIGLKKKKNSRQPSPFLSLALGLPARRRAGVCRT